MNSGRVALLGVVLLELGCSRAKPPPAPCSTAEARERVTHTATLLGNWYNLNCYAHRTQECVHRFATARTRLEEVGCQRTEEYVRVLTRQGDLLRHIVTEAMIAGLPSVSFTKTPERLEAKVAVSQNQTPARTRRENLAEAKRIYLEAHEVIRSLSPSAVSAETRFNVFFGLGHTEELLQNRAGAKVWFEKAAANAVTAEHKRMVAEPLRALADVVPAL